MNLNRARELIGVQLQFRSGYNRNSVRMILAEVQKMHGQGAVDQLIRELGLENRFDLKPGTDFSSLR
ncbi:hypothetical protein [Thiolapillus brandeum]|uniref:Uncharacterized protein n=1 Tax=Thiolapillus brandeum TaxID=1076588 RepID=A0A7U6GG84_9GAMM|nr:hypothetical protein [Thiolapillus brandeum]BAO43051.1 conserved hypothetical protein [Thiolapillus brandeum]